MLQVKNDLQLNDVKQLLLLKHETQRELVSKVEPVI